MDNVTDFVPVKSALADRSSDVRFVDDNIKKLFDLLIASSIPRMFGSSE